MEAVVPANELFPLLEWAIGSTVDFGSRLADTLPERSLLIGESFFLHRDSPAVWETLQAGALGGSQPADNILATGLCLCQKLSFFAVAFACTLVI